MLYRSEKWIINPQHWDGFGRIPPQGGPQADGEATLTRKGRLMGVPPTGGRDVGGGTSGGGYLCLPLSEHIFTFYCYQAHYVPVSCGGVEAGVKGYQAVVGSGRIGCGGDADGGSGGGTD